jgi:predicted translin family RNA/ssDNA-binding protein
MTSRLFQQSQLAAMGKKYAALDTARRELQALSADMLSASKRSIFAIQRADAYASSKELAQAVKNIKAAAKIVARERRLSGEGMWRAALEEYAEATMYHQAMTSGKVGAIPELPEDPDLFLGGLSDLTGELTRSAVLAATDRDVKEVKRLLEAVREAIAFMLTLNLTGTMRTKFDQAKSNLRKLEEIAFTLSVNQR